MKNITSLSYAAGFLLAELILAVYQVAGYFTGEQVRLLTGNYHADGAIAIVSAYLFFALVVKAIEGICTAPKRARLDMCLVGMLLHIIGLITGTACIVVVWHSQVAHVHM